MKVCYIIATIFIMLGLFGMIQGEFGAALGMFLVGGLSIVVGKYLE